MTQPSDAAIAPEPNPGPPAPMTENTFVATAAGNDDPPPPIKGLRRLLAWIIPANLGIYLIWGAVPGILLPQQITLLFGEADKVANLTIVATIGAFAAMIAQPIAGQISDRTRSRFGRRAPWMILGALAGGLALVGLAFADSLVGVVPQAPFIWTDGPQPEAAYDVTARPRRQDLTPEQLRYRETGSVYVTRPWVYDELDNRLGGRIGLFVMDELEGIDIDTELDLDVADATLRRLHAPAGSPA